MEAKKKSKQYLDFNQIGLIAAFGGAAFSFRALGVAIPLVPPLVIDPGALMPCFAGMAGGPLAGAIVGIARGIPSGTPMVDLWAQPIKGIYWAFVWQYIILRIKDSKRRWLAFGALTFLIQFFIEQPMYTAGNSFLLGLYPFYPTWPFGVLWYAVVYSIFQFAIFAVIIKIFPKMFKWETDKNKDL